MKTKMILAFGIAGLILAFGAMTVAMAQNTTNEGTNNVTDHECTQEMMENAPENCPGQMMQSGACEKMMNNGKGCSEMMENRGNDDKNEDTDHCADMGTMAGTTGKDMM